MKRTKKMFAILIALMIILSVSPAVYAADAEASSDTAGNITGASAGVGAIYITSADEIENRLWVDASKDNKASGSVLVLDKNSETLYSGGLSQIKGRGNSTWELEKKPYQIKLSEKAELVSGAGAAKTWVLLASYCDPTFIRTQIASDLSEALGLDCAIKGSWVELYYDGDYRGLYFLCEKVEVGSSRVDVPDLDDAVEEANPDSPAYDEPQTVSAVLDSGVTYCYVGGLNEPELAPQAYGYLLEIEYADRYRDEQSWLVTSRNQALIFKNPEYLTQETGAFIAGLWQEFEDAVFSENGQNPLTGKYFYDYCDLDSLTAEYLVQELTKNQDAFISSTYFYYDPADGMFHAGPPWDFDFSLGSGSLDESESINPENLQAGGNYLCKALYTLPEFRQSLLAAMESPAYKTAVTTLLSGEDTPGSIRAYAQTLSPAAEKNAALWGVAGYEPTRYRIAGIGSELTYDNTVSYLYDFLSQRSVWLENFILGGLDNFLAFGYTDISADDWYSDAVRYVTDTELFKGESATTFNPGGQCSRAMLVTVLYRLEGSPEMGSENFPDVPGNTWYSIAASWAHENAIIQGDENGNFCGSDPLTRGQAAVILYRYAEYKGLNSDCGTLDSFADLADIPYWAIEAACFCRTNGIISGDDEGNFMPDGPATRAQIAAILMRFIVNLM